MKVLEFGSRFSSAASQEYITNKTLLEYDLIICNPAVIGQLAQYYDTTVYLKRRNDVEEFIDIKNIPLVYFMPVSDQLRIKQNDTWTYKEFGYFVPAPKIQTERREGTDISVIPNTPFSVFLEKYKKFFSYTSVFKNRPGNIIAETPHTKHPLAFWTRDCVVLPTIEDSIKSVEKQFFEDLLVVLSALRPAQDVSALPTWTKDYYILKEKEVVKNIAGANSEIKRLVSLLEEQKARHAKIENYKFLFTSSGTSLELSVENLMKEIGFDIKEVEQNREDLIVKYKDKVAVVEVKGVNGTAAEKHAAQLEKWAASYLEENEVSPKPILIVNAFKDIPLDQRVDDPFPHQMLKYSISRGHCLITTTQLFGIYCEILENPQSQDALIEEIFAASGLFEKFRDWRDFIETA